MFMKYNLKKCNTACVIFSVRLTLCNFYDDVCYSSSDTQLLPIHFVLTTFWTFTFCVPALQTGSKHDPRLEFTGCSLSSRLQHAGFSTLTSPKPTGLPITSPTLWRGFSTTRSPWFPATLLEVWKTGIHKKRKRKPTTFGKPQIKGVVLKTLIKKPKKPNSANRKCVRLRLSNGKEVTAYVPGEGHSLQEHNIVLIRGGRVQDLPGVKHKVIRGKYDLPHVKK